MARTATCVWRISPDARARARRALGAPVDSYVNGTQTWLTDDGPGGRRDARVAAPPRRRATGSPGELSHYDLWEQVVGAALGERPTPDALVLGTEHRTLRSLWDGLECFAAVRRRRSSRRRSRSSPRACSGVAPDAVGLVDHDRIGAEWERADGTVSLVEMLLAELHA